MIRVLLPSRGMVWFPKGDVFSSCAKREYTSPSSAILAGDSVASKCSAFPRARMRLISGRDDVLSLAVPCTHGLVCGSSRVEMIFYL